LLQHPEKTVITTSTPKFGWVYNPTFPNDSQTGFRIIVSSNLMMLENGVGDIWDSGWLQSSNSINVPYRGSDLHADTDYFWRVATRDSRRQSSPFSTVQRFRRVAAGLEPDGLIFDSSTNIWANRYPLHYETVAPVFITNTAPGRWFIDFGRDAFGYVVIHLNGGSDGTNVEVRFGEMADGSSVNTHPKGLVRYGTNVFTLQNGDAIYSIHPPHHRGQTISPPSEYGVVMPFRYLELLNVPSNITPADVSQERLHSVFDDDAATFDSSSPALNQVWNLCKYSIKALTFDGVYVDGDRERKPYEADAYINQLSHYGVDREFTLPRYTFEYLAQHPTWPTEWSFHMVFIAWADYLQTGNADLLNKYYDLLKQKCLMDFARPDGLIQGKEPIIDWPAAERDGYVVSTNCTVVLNAFYYRCMRIMSQVALVTGHIADAADFERRANEVYASFNRVFWNPATHCYVDTEGNPHSSAHANFFPLAFGLVPSTNQTAVIDFLHAKGMAPSVYGAQYLLEGLYQASDADFALNLMTNDSPRSWPNMLKEGSTITTEAWNFNAKPNEDWNHAWGSAPGNIIPRYVLGLRPLEPGFGRILIQPQLGRSLSYVRGTIPTIRGAVSISATNVPGEFHLTVIIPGNVIATVMLPLSTTTNPVALVDGKVISGVTSNNWVTLTGIGAGRHDIVVRSN
jgi:alpha-L-rhamnosidase